MQRLLDMLTFRRPHKSQGEADFIDRFLAPYEPEEDGAGNYVIITDASSRTLFSCHIDTVHRNDRRQQICHDASMNIVYKDDDHPLGADDAVGVWLLLEMIDAGMPGTFIFHRGEERGGIGSSWRATYMAEQMRWFDRAIAFDRRGTTDIITHQCCGRCCSQEFANALATQLGNNYAPDDSGTFTDTANYADLIAECTNISCGYYHEHSPSETLDLEHVLALRDLVLQVDWEELPTVREPGEDDIQPAHWTMATPTRGEDLLDATLADFLDDELMYYDYNDMLALCESRPGFAANLMWYLIYQEHPAHSLRT